ncbi:hypothetical protein TNCV_4675791 [Trichonephila clavipes]|nr:hypothetical protein TNCV_4675791 [Trichonephila clavipes]
MERKKGIRTTADSVQSGWPVVASKKSNRQQTTQSSRAGAANPNQNRNSWTLVKREKKNRGARAGVTVDTSFKPIC